MESECEQKFLQKCDINITAFSYSSTYFRFQTEWITSFSIIYLQNVPSRGHKTSRVVHVLLSTSYYMYNSQVDKSHTGKYVVCLLIPSFSSSSTSYSPFRITYFRNFFVRSFFAISLAFSFKRFLYFFAAAEGPSVWRVKMSTYCCSRINSFNTIKRHIHITFTNIYLPRNLW